MPKRTLAELCRRAIAGGVDPALPALAIAAATRPEQDVISGTIGDIARRLQDAGPTGPLLVMIGSALAEAAAVDAATQRDPTSGAAPAQKQAS
jgi:uroporphyrin-III C-methyltransferase/precorrin-2 dehydrogenase/sirohydrochlorin ferrochelatase